MWIAKRWFVSLLHRVSPDTNELAKASEARRHAERNLKDARSRNKEIARVVGLNKRFEDDMFTAKIRAAFRGEGPNSVD